MNPRRLPPGPRSWLPGRTWVAFKTGRLGFLDRAAAYGPVAGWRAGTQRFYLLSDPDLIRDLLITNHALVHKGRALERARAFLGDGLLTSESPEHDRRKPLVMPAFHRDRLGAYAGIMAEDAEREAAAWRDGETRDLHADMMRLTLGVVGRTLFGRAAGPDAAELGRHFTRVMESFLLYMIPFTDLWLRLPVPAALRLRESAAYLDRTIQAMVEDRRRSGVDRGDLLSMLIAARDADGGGGLSDRQLRDECLTLLAAGHETTANGLAWALDLLAAHPDIQDRVAAECREAIGDRTVRLEDAPALAAAERVFAEALRLYPPVWNIARRAIRDYPVAGWIAPAGSILLASPWVMHRHPRHFPDPARFDPDRWVAAPRTGLHPGVYFPFSRGPRGCVGEGFAWIEGWIILATIVRRWRLTRAPGPAPRPQPLLTLRPRGGVRLIVRRRD